ADWKMPQATRQVSAVNPGAPSYGLDGPGRCRPIESCRPLSRPLQIPPQSARLPQTPACALPTPARRTASLLLDLRHQRGEYAVGIRSPIPVELPGAPSLRDQLEIAVDEKDFLIGAGLTQHLAGGVECDAMAVIHVVAFLTGAV